MREKKSTSIWKARFDEISKKYQKLKKKAQPFLDALEIASERVRAFINSILTKRMDIQEQEMPDPKRRDEIEHELC